MEDEVGVPYGDRGRGERPVADDERLSEEGSRATGHRDARGVEDRRAHADRDAHDAAVHDLALDRLATRARPDGQALAAEALGLDITVELLGH